MYATIGTEIPDDGDRTFEPKDDGMGVIAFADRRSVRLVTHAPGAKTRPRLERLFASERAHDGQLEAEGMQRTARGARRSVA
jgi:hypothetical protein